LIFTDLPPSGRYGECGRAHRFARAHSSRCGVDLYGSAADSSLRSVGPSRARSI